MEIHLLHWKGEIVLIADKNKLKVAMARACFNTSDLAQKADMPLPTLKNVIAGRSVKPITLGKIARALNVDVTELIEV